MKYILKKLTVWYANSYNRIQTRKEQYLPVSSIPTDDSLREYVVICFHLQSTVKWPHTHGTTTMRHLLISTAIIHLDPCAVTFGPVYCHHISNQAEK